MATKPKAVTPSMLKALKTAAGQFSFHATSFSHGAGKTYEAWILFELAAALKAIDVKVVPLDHRLAPVTSTFRVRGGPGYIPSNPGLSSTGPCHFALLGNGTYLELHSSLRHCGSSETKHELDISIIDNAAADAVRKQPTGGAYLGRRFLGIELKEYDASQTLPLNLARALLGAAVDLDIKTALTSTSINGSDFGFRSRDIYWLLTTAATGRSSITLLNRYRIRIVGEVVPGSITDPTVLIAHQVWRCFWPRSKATSATSPTSLP